MEGPRDPKIHDRFLRLSPRCAFRIDCYLCCLLRFGTGWTHYGGNWQKSSSLAGRWRYRDGVWDLVHALRWDAGVQPSGTDSVRLAHCIALSPSRRFRLCGGIVRGEPQENGMVKGISRECDYGWGYLDNALYRHGSHAFAGTVFV